jgi:hypothetical protein
MFNPKAWVCRFYLNSHPGRFFAVNFGQAHFVVNYFQAERWRFYEDYIYDTIKRELNYSLSINRSKELERAYQNFSTKQAGCSNVAPHNKMLL